MTTPLHDRVPTHDEIVAFSDEHDRRWGRLDFDGVADMWVGDGPPPMYLGEEYAEPVVGADALARHFGRLAARVGAASMTSRVVDTASLGAGVARCVRLTQWSITPREQTAALSGTCWITWVLVDDATRLRIAHHMETAVYDRDDPYDRDESSAPAQPMTNNEG